MKFPKRFKVKGKTWTFKLQENLRDDEGNKCQGLTDFDKRRIYVESALTGKHAEWIFWHEYAHAVLWESGVTGNDGGLPTLVEEIICDNIADAFIQDKSVRFKKG
jgi:uncharacterized protein YjaZ